MGLTSRQGWTLAFVATMALSLAVVTPLWGLLPALGIGLVGGGSLATAIPLRRLIARKEPSRRSTEQRLQDVAIRRFWQASGDFEANAWAGQDLETLRLLALNVSEGTELKDRLAERLRSVISTVLAGVLDRAHDVVVSARESELDAESSERLAEASRVLAERLEGVSLRAGEPLELDTRSVAAASEVVLVETAALREKLRPRIAADVPPIVRWLVRSRHRVELDAGALELELESLGDIGPVAVRPLDLIAVLDDLLGTIFARGQVAGPVQVSGEDHGEQLRLVVSWAVRDRWHLEPAQLLEPLRPLSFYGAQLAVEEDLEVGAIALEAWLPRVGATTAPPAKEQAL